MGNLLHNRLFLVQLGILATGLALLVLLGHILLGGYLRDSQLAIMPATTASRAEQLGTILRYKELLIQRLATDEAVERFLYSENPKEIEPLIEKFIPEFAAVVLLDERGAPYFGPLPADAAVPELDPDLVQRLLWQPNRPWQFYLHFF